MIEEKRRAADQNYANLRNVFEHWEVEDASKFNWGMILDAAKAQNVNEAWEHEEIRVGNNGELGFALRRAALAAAGLDDAAIDARTSFLEPTWLLWQLVGVQALVRDRDLVQDDDLVKNMKALMDKRAYDEIPFCPTSSVQVRGTLPRQRSSADRGYQSPIMIYFPRKKSSSQTTEQVVELSLSCDMIFCGRCVVLCCRVFVLFLYFSFFNKLSSR